MNFITIIPCRKGSKGIKNKNIIKLKNQPLFSYSLNVAKKIKNIKKIIISTNDLRIINQTKTEKKTIVHNRKNTLSSAGTLMHEVILNILKEYKELFDDRDSIILLQPTSPQRTVKDLNNAIKKFNLNKKNYDALVTVSEPFNHPREIILKKNKKVIFYKKRNTKSKNRQNYSKALFINGSIFISKIKTFKKFKSFFHKKTFYYETNKKFSLDLNDYLDLKLMKQLI